MLFQRYFNVKTHIYTLSFTDSRIVNGYELPYFFDLKITSDKFN